MTTECFPVGGAFPVPPVPTRTSSRFGVTRRCAAGGRCSSAEERSSRPTKDSSSHTLLRMTTKHFPVGDGFPVPPVPIRTPPFLGAPGRRALHGLAVAGKKFSHFVNLPLDKLDTLCYSIITESSPQVTERRVAAGAVFPRGLFFPGETPRFENLHHDSFP